MHSDHCPVLDWCDLANCGAQTSLGQHDEPTETIVSVGFCRAMGACGLGYLRVGRADPDIGQCSPVLPVLVWLPWGEDAFHCAVDAFDVSVGGVAPRCVVVPGVVEAAEWHEVVEIRGSAVLPRHHVVPLAVFNWGVAVVPGAGVVLAHAQESLFEVCAAAGEHEVYGPVDGME